MVVWRMSVLVILEVRMKERVTEIATSMIAFSTFFVGLTAVIFYIYQIKKLDLSEMILVVVIYINVNLFFLYVLIRWSKDDKMD